MRIPDLFNNWDIKPKGLIHIGAYTCGEQVQYSEAGMDDSRVLWIESNPNLYLKTQGLVTNNNVALPQLLSNNDIDVENYDMLVMDIQGGLLALQGMVSILAKFEHIYIKVKSCELIVDIENFLYRFGFAPKDKVITENDWCDGLFSKDASIQINGDKVYAFIKGRLGNQMFQYWVCLWVAITLGRPLHICFSEPCQIDSNIYANIQNFGTGRNHYSLINNAPDRGIYRSPSVNIESIIDSHMYSTVPIILDIYAEDYSNIKKHESWIRKVFERSAQHPLICNNHIVIHLRLGDLSHDCIMVHQQYIQYCQEVCQIHNDLQICIISEEPGHECTRSLYYALVTSHPTIKVMNSDSVQTDFDTISSASVIVCSNSTFTWWAAFLNPFQPNVYVALSSKTSNAFRNDDLFLKGVPDKWKLWDLDEQVFIVV